MTLFDYHQHYLPFDPLEDQLMVPSTCSARAETGTPRNRLLTSDGCGSHRSLRREASLDDNSDDMKDGEGIPLQHARAMKLMEDEPNGAPTRALAAAVGSVRMPYGAGQSNLDLHGGGQSNSIKSRPPSARRSLSARRLGGQPLSDSSRSDCSISEQIDRMRPLTATGSQHLRSTQSAVLGVRPPPLSARRPGSARVLVIGGQPSPMSARQPGSARVLSARTFASSLNIPANGSIGVTGLDGWRTLTPGSAATLDDDGSIHI